MNQLTRRAFLKSAALAGAGLAAQGAASTLAQDGTPPPPPAFPDHWDGSPMGRILESWLTEYSEPNWKSKPTGKGYGYNKYINVLEAVAGAGLYTTNNTYLRTETGYVYSSWVQPVHNVDFNTPATPDASGLWAMVTVPLTWSRNKPDDKGTQREKMYYNTVFRVMAVENGYYKVKEVYGYEYWIKAAHMRIITPEELAPISTHVAPEAKRIEISVRDQRLWAYENEVEVLNVPVSTGRSGRQTPQGTFAVQDKRIGQRMTGGASESFYNLAGIPFICYFNKNWVALHGCYWHNDYGRRHSNGCVNLRPDHAMWLFRWTTPHANYWDFLTKPDPANGQPGTVVKVRF